MSRTARFSLVREEARRYWRELRGPVLRPLPVAVAVALGGLAGMPPATAARILVLPLLCIWFQLDGAIALACALGMALARTMHALSGQATAAATLAAAVLAAGLVAAIPRALRDRRRRYALPPEAPPWVVAIEQLSTRYASPASTKPTDRMQFQWVRTKLLGDPVAKIVADLATGTVLDIGCGRGQIALLLLFLGRASRVHGIDWDAAKIAAAAHAGEGLDATFVRGDARTAPFEAADTVLLIDLLHYFAVDEQDAILARAADAVRPGGSLLLREADAAAGWRSVVTLIEERIFTFLRVNRGERVRFRPARELAARLEAAGLACEIRPAQAGTPFSNVLIVGRRPA
jgi:SAM-dependent methyltransferase